MADVPEIYADNVSVTSSKFGVTLALLRTMPNINTATAEVTGVTHEVAGLVRMSQPLAEAMIEVIAQNLAQTAQAIPQTKTTVRH